MESEAVTRRKRIDPRLKAAGWQVGPFLTSYTADAPAAVAVEEWPTEAGPADYALCDRGVVCGVVEAKKLTIGPQGVLTQAERYSRGISAAPKIRGEFGVPFLYSTNGESIHFHDVRREQNRSRQVAGFHTPTALAELLARDIDAELAALARLSMNQRLRPYQVEANQGWSDSLVTAWTGRHD